jgi:hypothetical protein
MKRLLIVIPGLVFCLASNSNGQELVYDFQPDSAIYSSMDSRFVIVAPEDLTAKYSIDFYFTLERRNSDIIDIFARTGKIGSCRINKDLYNQYGDNPPRITQKVFDSDDGWEILYQNYFGVLLVDDDGTTLFKYGDGVANDTIRYSSSIGFDGNSTYICIQTLTNSFLRPYKLYRFRTNISPTSPHTLTKKAVVPNTMMVFGASSGDYQVSLIPTGGGKTTVQLFDMLGRLVFEKRIDDLTKPVSFSIPAEQSSRTPFITRVQDQNGTVLKKEIPVR